MIAMNNHWKPKRPLASPAPHRIVQPKFRPAAHGHRGNVVQPAVVAVGAVAAAAVVAAVASPGVRRSARVASAGYTHAYLPMIAGYLISPTTIDKHGTQYWNGYRATLSFNAGTKAAKAGSKAGGCQIGKATCSGAATSLDHIVDFATTQSSLATHTYCDGSHHWTGVLLTDAQADYNKLSNLRWSCTSCNSSKGGARGLYSPPRHAGRCPGATCAL